MRGIVSLAAALGAPARHGERRALSLARRDHRHHLRGDPGHARAPGADPVAPDPPAPAAMTTRRSSSRRPTRARRRAARRSRGSTTSPGVRRRRTRTSSGCARSTPSGWQRASSIDPGVDPESARAQAAIRRLRHETLSAERRALIALRDEGAISDDVLHRLEQELDIEAIRIGVGRGASARATRTADRDVAARTAGGPRGGRRTSAGTLASSGDARRSRAARPSGAGKEPAGRAGDQDAAEDPVSRVPGGIGPLIVLSGVDHDGAAVGVEERGRPGAERHAIGDRDVLGSGRSRPPRGREGRRRGVPRRSRGRAACPGD